MPSPPTNTHQSAPKPHLNDLPTEIKIRILDHLFDDPQVLLWNNLGPDSDPEWELTCYAHDTFHMLRVSRSWHDLAHQVLWPHLYLRLSFRAIEHPFVDFLPRSLLQNVQIVHLESEFDLDAPQTLPDLSCFKALQHVVVEVEVDISYLCQDDYVFLAERAAGEPVPPPPAQFDFERVVGRTDEEIVKTAMDLVLHREGAQKFRAFLEASKLPLKGMVWFMFDIVICYTHAATVDLETGEVWRNPDISRT